MNHFKEVCNQRRRTNTSFAREVVANDYDYSSDDHEYDYDKYDMRSNVLFMGEITVSQIFTNIYENDNNLKSDVHAIKMKDWVEPIKLNEHTVQCKIDTGAQANVISVSELSKIDRNLKVSLSNINLRGYGGSDIPTVGKISLKCSLQNSDSKIDSEFMVVPLNVTTIIGLDTTVRLVNPQITSHSCDAVVERCNGNNSVESQPPTSIHTTAVSTQSQNTQSVRNGNSELDSILTRHKEVFDNSKVGCMTDYTCHIRLKEGSVPVIHPPRTVPLPLMEAVKDELKRMEGLGVIEKVEKPTDWVNSMVTVRKPDTDTLRICLDPTDLNAYHERTHSFTDD